MPCLVSHDSCRVPPFPCIEMRGRVSARRACVRARDRSKGVTTRTTSCATERASLDDDDARGRISHRIEIELNFIRFRISIDFESRAVAENANARVGANESIRVSFARRARSRAIAFECVLRACD